MLGQVFRSKMHQIIMVFVRGFLVFLLCVKKQILFFCCCTNTTRNLYSAHVNRYANTVFKCQIHCKSKLIMLLFRLIFLFFCCSHLSNWQYYDLSISSHYFFGNKCYRIYDEMYCCFCFELCTRIS